MQSEHRVQYDGIHCNLAVEQFPRAIVLRISGSDVGEFGDAPMQVLNGWLAALTSTVDFFIDARDVRTASIDVSGEWARWMGANKESLRTVTMLTGSRFIQVTAEFVRRYADLEGKMRICTEPELFDTTLAAAIRPK